MAIYSLDVLLFNIEPVHCPMSSSNCCFLTGIQVSQESGKVVWYSPFFKNFQKKKKNKNFPVCCDPHKGFTWSKKQKEMFFWNSLAFYMIQQVSAIWSLVPLPLWNPACTSGSSHFMYCWSLAWRILSIALLACEIRAIAQ